MKIISPSQYMNDASVHSAVHKAGS